MMFYPLVLHEHSRAFRELFFDPLERPRIAFERD